MFGLCRELVHVPAKEMQLLPQYARIAATLSEVHKDVGQGVVSALEENFQHLFQKKDQIDLDNKLRTVRFLGELCKFRVAPPGTIFACLKACYDDFTHHNVDAACALLESCGRFLCRLRETATRANNMLSILRRLKNAKNLDQRQSALVDSAYFHCRPPERKKYGSEQDFHQLITSLTRLAFGTTGKGRIRAGRSCMWSTFFAKYSTRKLSTWW